MTPEQREVLALRDSGLSHAAIGEQLGISTGAVKKRLARCRKWIDAPPGQKAAIEVSGLDMNTAKSGWRVIQHEDGSRDSVYWRAEQATECPEDVLERIADRMNAVLPAPSIRRPKSPSSELRNFIPVSDVHLSMRVGQYGTAQAVDRLREGQREIVDRMPAAEVTLIVNNGDFTEANDNDALTPASKHPLAVDTDYDDTTDIAVDATVDLIEVALTKSDRVIYKALKGNHDPHTALILRAALRQRYRKCDRVTIEVEGHEIFAHAWGGNLICAMHGDQRANPKDIVLALAARYPDMWAAAWFREVFTGHLHHLSQHELPGMVWNRLRAVCPAGRYANKHLMTALSEMVGITYRESGGRYGTYPCVFR